MSVKQKIIASDLFKSGEPFGPTRMALEIGEDRNAVGSALAKMRSRGEVYAPSTGLFCAPPARHWIYTRRLA